MCFLLDPAGLLLSHSDFLIDEEQAADLGDQVTGEVGVWPITNIFIGLKEPALAHALIAAGVLKIESNKVNEDNSALLSYYFIDETKFADDSVVVGAQPIDSPTCMESGAEWKLAYIENTNAYLLVVDKYQRKTDQSNCVPFGAAEPIEIEHLPCDTTKKEANPDYRSPLIGRCPVRRGANIEHMERLREKYTIDISSTICTRELFVERSSSIGILSLACAALLAICSIGLFCALFYFRKRPILRMSSPVFCYLICLGGLFSAILIVLLSGRPTDGICIARNWIGSIAFLLLFGPLFAKSHRIARLFNNKKLRKQTIKNKSLFAVIGILGAMQCAILLIWSLADSPKMVLRQDEFSPHRRYVECDSENYSTYSTIDLAFKSLLTLWGSYLAWITRAVSTGFNESKEIGVSTYNIFLMGIIIIPLLFGVDLTYDIRLILQLSAISICVLVCLLVLFIPKLLVVDKNKEYFDQNNKSTVTSEKSSKKYPRSPVSSGPSNRSGEESDQT